MIKDRMFGNYTEVRRRRIFFAMSEVGVDLNIDFELPVNNKAKKS